MNIIRLKTFYVIFLNLSTNMFPTTLTSSKADNKKSRPADLEKREIAEDISFVAVLYPCNKRW